MAKIGVGVRQAWPGKGNAVSTKMELALRWRVLRDWRRNGGGGKSDRVPDSIPF
jgi:hypothetical protein